MVFTCVTDTGRLIWNIRLSSISYHSTALLNKVISLDTVFNTILHSITGNTFCSTATALHVPVSCNGTKVVCEGVANSVQDKAEIIIEIGNVGWLI